MTSKSESPKPLRQNAIADRAEKQASASGKSMKSLQSASAGNVKQERPASPSSDARGIVDATEEWLGTAIIITGARKPNP